MKLYLSSDKLGNKQYILKQWIQENENKIILIANSRDCYEDGPRKEEGIMEDINSLSELGFEVKNISLKDYFGNCEKLKTDLEGYHAFYVIGGNTFTLRKAMQLSGFDNYLKEKAKDSRYLYAGYSAGICVLAPSLKGIEIVDEPINPYNSDDVIYDGVGLLDYVPVPHYKSERPESKFMDDVVEYMIKNNINYKTLKDGEVIIEEIKNEEILEKCLPNYLENDLQNLKEGIKNNVNYLDCLINELQGSVNSAFVDGDITEEQCDYLYKKYIRMEG